jgi:hypothetical protein
MSGILTTTLQPTLVHSAHHRIPPFLPLHRPPYLAFSNGRFPGGEPRQGGDVASLSLGDSNIRQHRLRPRRRETCYRNRGKDRRHTRHSSLGNRRSGKLGAPCFGFKSERRRDSLVDVLPFDCKGWMNGFHVVTALDSPSRMRVYEHFFSFWTNVSVAGGQASGFKHVPTTTTGCEVVYMGYPVSKCWDPKSIHVSCSSYIGDSYEYMWDGKFRKSRDPLQ